MSKSRKNRPRELAEQLLDIALELRNGFTDAEQAEFVQAYQDIFFNRGTEARAALIWLGSRMIR